jgi:hypothetical protein
VTFLKGNCNYACMLYMTVYESVVTNIMTLHNFQIVPKKLNVCRKCAEQKVFHSSSSNNNNERKNWKSVTGNCS